ncbi:MAG TPA: hypothetical protein VGB79_07775 [Allosphingosinicella sp.]|jgi:uncharacterized membrane protein
MTRCAATLLLAALAAACNGAPEAEEANGAGQAAPRQPAPAAGNAAAPAAPPAPAAVRTAPMSATGYALVGTEPFWGGTVTGTSVRYMVPERQFGDVVETRRTYGPGSETYSGSFRGRPFVLTLTRAPCSDGMSERPFAFAATLQVLGETRRGCADPEEPRPQS